MEESTLSQWWAWDLYPLASGAWPNEFVIIEGVQPGHSYINKRTHIEHRRVPYLENIRAWSDGQTERVPVVTSRYFYRPTTEDIEFLRNAMPSGDAENPSWHTIEAELVSGGLQSGAISNQKAPTLIRFLRQSRTQGSATGRTANRPSSSTARRRQLPKAVETAVLTKSGRRCCICFALQNDVAVKGGQVAHLDDNPSNNKLDNLAWLCLEHHAQWHTRGNMTKGFTVEEVKTYRTSLYNAIENRTLFGDPEVPTAGKSSPTFNTTARDKSTVINTVGDVNIRGGRKAVAVAAPPDAIGSNIEMRSYVEYLVKRYIDWRNSGIKRGIDRRPFFPGIMNNLIKSNFGSRVNLVPQSRFDEVVAFVQKAIDKTIWGKNNRDRNYHSFEEHRAQVHGNSQDSSASAN